MKDGRYSVIGYIPDPARQEALNIGVLTWSPLGYRLRIDPDAISRVIRENPKLERDALLYVEGMLEHQLDIDVANPSKDIPRFIEGHPGFPVLFSEPRFTALPELGDDPIGRAAEALVERVVRPKRRHGGGGLQLTDVLKRELRLYISQGVISINHVFGRTRTGRQRRVDFYANSGANLAIDVLRLAVQKADEITLRADAEAFKVFDIRGADRHLNYVVLCEFASDEELRSTNATARRVIEWAGGEVVTSPEAVVTRLARQTGFETLR